MNFWSFDSTILNIFISTDIQKRRTLAPGIAEVPKLPIGPRPGPSSVPTTADQLSTTKKGIQ